MPMQPIRLRTLSDEEHHALDAFYRAERSARLKLRALAILLAAERALVAAEIAEIIRSSESSVRRWIKRFNAEGLNGLRDAPRPGKAKKASKAYRTRLLAVVRQRPRSLDQPYSLWTLTRLADFMAEETGERVSHESVRRYLQAGGIVLSRPQHTITSPDPEYQLKKRRLKPSETRSSPAKSSTTPTSSTSPGTRR
jgi:transposase